MGDYKVARTMRNELPGPVYSLALVFAHPDMYSQRFIGACARCDGYGHFSGNRRQIPRGPRG